MDFSSTWRSIFPTSSVFFPPSLLQSDPLQSDSLQSNTLHFVPSPPLPLLSSPLLLPHSAPLPSPPLHLHSLLSFLSSLSPLPLPFPPHSPSFPLSNLLSSLPSLSRPDSLHLFFPSGENSHSLAFLSVSFPCKEVILDLNGDVFVQVKGFKHPFHRISCISAVQARGLSAGKISDGFLFAVTLYSVNWFRVEARELGSGKWVPGLEPMGNQGFDFPVLNACFSPFFAQESLVLLESGDLFLFNLKCKKLSRIRVRVNEGDESVEWISCAFGAQPWLALVASSKGVILVDLRDGEQGQSRNLCKIERLGLYDVNPIEERSVKILSFCKASYDCFHFSVLTESQLMVFDTRRGTDPVLTWDHGLENPNFISMFELDQLGKSSKDSQKGFVIFAGSFSTGLFNMFCYVKNGLETSSSVQTCGLPSRLSLTGQTEILDDLFSKEADFVKDFGFISKREEVVGFLVIPKNLSLIEPGSGGFTLIRLMSFGRLELQNYRAFSDSESLQNQKKCSQNGILKQCDILEVCPNCTREKLPSRRYLLDMKYLNAYLNGDLSETLNTNGREILKEIPLSESLKELIKDSINQTSSLSPFINNASTPTNLFEIAIKSGLNNLKPDLLPLAFGKYSDLFANNRDSNFQLLEVSRETSEMETLFDLKPFRRGQKWSGKAEWPKESLVGPILPVPVLLSLEERESVGTDSILDQKCVKIMEIVSSTISIAETEDPNENNNNKDFYVYEPKFDSNIKNNDNNKLVCRNEMYETFICGVNKNKNGEICGLKPKTKLGAIDPGFFDLGEIKYDFDSREIEVQSREKEMLEKLKNQFSKCLYDYKPYQDFCTNLKVPKCT